MSSSITTAVPSGLISTNWCIQDSIDYEGKPQECADSTRGENASDFETICCAGEIVDTTSDLYRYGNANDTINLDSLVCCRIDGSQPGGLQPIPTDRTQCTQGNPTPLVSFAATNTDNAALWEKTYTSAAQSIGPSTTSIGDFVPLQSPRCLWVYTKTGVAMQNVTVPAADITTPPARTTDAMGNPVTTSSIASNGTATSSTSSSGSSSISDITSSAALTSSATEAATSAEATSGATSAHALHGTAWLIVLAFGWLRAMG